MPLPEGVDARRRAARGRAAEPGGAGQAGPRRRAPRRRPAAARRRRTRAAAAGTRRTPGPARATDARRTRPDRAAAPGRVSAAADATARRHSTRFLRGRSPPATPRAHTQRSYETAVGAYLDWLAAAASTGGRPSRADLRAYLAELGLGAAPAARPPSGSRRSARSTGSRPARASPPGDPWGAIATPRLPRRLPRVLEVDEVERLLAAVDDELAAAGGDGHRAALATAIALRDRALVETAYAAGLRISELAAADLGSLDLRRGEIRVLGKGRKERIGLLGRPARAALDGVPRGRPARPRRAASAARARRPPDGRRADRGLPEPPRRGRSASAACATGSTCSGAGPACRTASRPTRSATRSRPTCSRAARTCGSSRSCSATRASRRRRSTRTSRRPACGPPTAAPIRARRDRPRTVPRRRRRLVTTT